MSEEYFRGMWGRKQERETSMSDEYAIHVRAIEHARELMADDPEEDLKAELGNLYRVLDYDTAPPSELFDCGSSRLKDTPKALYRVLILIRPARLSFGDMHKTRLLTLVDPTGELAALFEFYKYEAAIYFVAKKRHIEGRGRNIICGLPGSDNGFTTATDYSREWFSLLVDCLNREWMVYGGNDFTV